MLQQRLARGRGLHAMALACEQRGTHDVLQLGQPFADGRADDVGLLAGARDVPRLANADEKAQSGEIEIAQKKLSKGIPNGNVICSNISKKFL